MKIKLKDEAYEEVLKHRMIHQKPVRPSIFLTALIKFLSRKDLKKVNFSYETYNMDSISKKEPCLFLMNHSSFIDLRIAYKVISPRKFNIVCTDDGFVGKAGLMRRIGCIPTRKFSVDTLLVRNMVYAIRKLKDSILMYPEASYSFDGTATPLPSSIGKCIKLLDVPVVMIKTEGAFLRDPLYNDLQLRDVNVSCRVGCIITKEEVKSLSPKEITDIVNKHFIFDNFKYQQENNIIIDEPFRADKLNRVLYRCPNCNYEGKMEGKGINIRCDKCNKTYELTETGFLKALTGETRFRHVPDWYKWERECVKKEIRSECYKEEMDCNIYMLVDFKKLYRVGDGHLVHNMDGFTLDGIDGKLHYTQEPKESYSLYSDFYWYELGDVICIGDEKVRYYCIPTNKKDIVAKVRLATEELYKYIKEKEKNKIKKED